MSHLTVAAPAKINLHLQILGARPDNHHEVWTLFQTIDLCDDLMVGDVTDDSVTMVVEPAGAAPEGGDNLVVKAASLLRKRTGVRRGAEILLRKRIPVGAGLGGGSADAAAALVALDRLWGLRWLLRTWWISQPGSVRMWRFFFMVDLPSVAVAET